LYSKNCFDWLGNVEALGIRAGQAFLMSQKHTLANKRERERILETGKTIFLWNFIDLSLI